jgi:MerR family copper efflux transcriptional regulator
MKRQASPRHSQEPQPPALFTIGQVARLSGITSKAIRYYESVGVLQPPQRQENGYRRYDQADLNRLILLRCLRQLGVPFETLKPLLHQTADTCGADIQQEVLRLIEGRIQAIDHELRELSQLRQALACNQQLLACQPSAQEPFRECRVTCLPWQQEEPDETGSLEKQNDLQWKKTAKTGRAMINAPSTT